MPSLPDRTTITLNDAGLRRHRRRLLNDLADRLESLTAIVANADDATADLRANADPAETRKATAVLLAGMANVMAIAADVAAVAAELRGLAGLEAITVDGTELEDDEPEP